MKTDTLLRIYKVVRTKPKPKYPPVRKHYNVHLFGGEIQFYLEIVERHSKSLMRKQGCV